MSEKLNWRVVIEKLNGTRRIVFVKAVDMNEVSAAIWETEPASSQIVSIEEVPPDEEVMPL